jgi:hypothetical protein
MGSLAPGGPLARDQEAALHAAFNNQAMCSSAGALSAPLQLKPTSYAGIRMGQQHHHQQLEPSLRLPAATAAAIGNVDGTAMNPPSPPPQPSRDNSQRGGTLFGPAADLHGPAPSAAATAADNQALVSLLLVQQQQQQQQQLQIQQQQQHLAALAQQVSSSRQQQQQQAIASGGSHQWQQQRHGQHPLHMSKSWDTARPSSLLQDSFHMLPPQQLQQQLQHHQQQQQQQQGWVSVPPSLAGPNGPSLGAGLMQVRPQQLHQPLRVLRKADFVIVNEVSAAPVSCSWPAHRSHH